MEELKVQTFYVRRGALLLKNVNFSVEEGTTCAVTGKSGSGKSTLIRAVGGALRPLAGRILYGGREMYEDECAIRREMSVIYDAPNFNMELKPERFVRELAKFEPWFDREAFSVYMEQLELDPRLRVKLYSEEMQRKLMLVLALCRKPGLLVADELTSGVDSETRSLMWGIVDKYRQDHPLTVLFTTHHEEEMKRADQIIRLPRENDKEEHHEAVL